MVWRAAVYKKLREDSRFKDKAILYELQYRLNAMLNREGFSAYKTAFGSNPVDLSPWQDNDSDLDFVQKTSIPIQFTLQ